MESLAILASIVFWVPILTIIVIIVKAIRKVK